MRVLIAEDDPSVSGALATALGKAGHLCTRVTRGADVLAQHTETDVLMLDLGLEDMDGLDVLARLRDVAETPVIVVTARDDERSTVRALRSGADDYLVKPVRLHELLARLTAVTRRYATADVIHVGQLRIDQAAHTVTHEGTRINLTPTEFSLLVALARSAGTAVERQTVLERIWGPGYAATSRSFDVHLAQLRQKLPMLTITTIRGFGFRLEQPA
ncbi:MAG: response regulator transcription factor [Galactobacter sp.]